MKRAFGFYAKVALLATFALLSFNFLFAHEAESKSNIVILKSEDPIPQRAVKVEAVALGYNANADYSYYELLEQAKGLAYENDANVIKITERIGRSSDGAEKIKVVLYKAENAEAYESEFSWKKDRLLSWEDFKGPVPAGATQNTAAATFCGIGFETNTVRDKNDKVKVYVYNTFYKHNSWAKQQYMDEHVLAHEQGHFDLCEIYTRKLRERIEQADITPANMKTTLKSIYKEVQSAYLARQEKYEHDTQHGVDRKQQQRWQDMIEKELVETEEWML